LSLDFTLSIHKLGQNFSDFSSTLVGIMALAMKGLTRGVALWLSAILFCLSVAAPAHSLEHLDDGGANSHCTLCIQKVQLNSLLPSSDFSFSLPQLQVESHVEALFSTLSSHVRYFQSRAPPIRL
jgi:hypothetical protein